MNEKLDLVEILKDCPRGTKLYSTVHDDVFFEGIIDLEYPIQISNKNIGVVTLSEKGRLIIGIGECILFPSKDQRDWSKFKTPIKKFDYSTLKPFDRVLVRDNDRDIWRCSLFTCFRKGQIVCEVSWEQGIPDNDETRHLVGTTDMPDEKYIWWE